jgi:hypothetical protein
MCQWISGWSGRLLAVVGGVVASAMLVLASAAPVLAKTSKPFHGGAHGHVNTLVQSGHVMPLDAHDLIAFGVAAAVVGIAVAVERRLVGRGSHPLRRMGRPSAPADQTKSRGRAA